VTQHKAAHKPDNHSTVTVTQHTENIKLPVSISNDDTLHVQQSVDPFDVGISFFVHIHTYL